MNSFKERLNEAIKNRGISKAELARRTGIGRNSISDYTNGRYEAKQDNLYLLARELDVNEAWLMGLDVPMPKEPSFDTDEKLAEIMNVIIERKEHADLFLKFVKLPSEKLNALEKLIE